MKSAAKIDRKATPADLMAREDNGQFAAGFDRLCTCGHTLGMHTAARPHECIASDFVATLDCDCTKFNRAVKKTRALADYSVKYERVEDVWVLWQRVGEDVRGLALSEHELRSEAFAHLDQLRPNRRQRLKSPTEQPFSMREGTEHEDDSQ